jgi:hypothetical protein
MTRKPSKADRAWTDYTGQFRKQVLPALLESAFVLRLAENRDADSLDLRSATELGVAIQLDKPLVVVVPRGSTISAALRRAAHITLDDFDVDDPASQDRIATVFRQLEEEGAL